MNDLKKTFRAGPTTSANLGHTIQVGYDGPNRTQHLLKRALVALKLTFGRDKNNEQKTLRALQDDQPVGFEIHAAQ